MCQLKKVICCQNARMILFLRLFSQHSPAKKRKELWETHKGFWLELFAYIVVRDYPFCMCFIWIRLRSTTQVKLAFVDVDMFIHMPSLSWSWEIILIELASCAYTSSTSFIVCQEIINVCSVDIQHHHYQLMLYRKGIRCRCNYRLHCRGGTKWLNIRNCLKSLFTEFITKFQGRIREKTKKFVKCKKNRSKVYLFRKLTWTVIQ